MPDNPFDAFIPAGPAAAAPAPLLSTPSTQAPATPAPAAPNAPAPGPAPKPASPAPANPFETFLPQGAQPKQYSATSAFFHNAEQGILPSLGGMAAAGAGAEIGGAVGAAAGGPLAPITGAIGGIAGGVAGFIGGARVVQGVQDWALSQLPASWQDALGSNEQQQRMEAQQHPTASFIGGIAPYALTMSPLGAGTKLAANATAFQRIAANPLTSRLLSGTMMGGMELGQEKTSGQPLNWQRIGIATGFGMMFNRPNAIGERLTGLGAGLVRPTVAQAADAQVMGPGITEAVFQGSHEQDPAAQMTAQDAARTEQSIIGEPAPAPDLHTVARQMHPELFAQYDALNQQANDLRSWIDNEKNPDPDDIQAAKDKLDYAQGQLNDALNPPMGAPRSRDIPRLRAVAADAQAQYDDLSGRAQAWASGNAQETAGTVLARQHLQEVNAQIAEMAPDIGAAYRRAAETPAGAATQPEEEAVAAAAEPVQADADPAQPGAEPASPAPSIEAQRNFIATDVEDQLYAAGRPRDEAAASGQIVAHYYATRAARLNGALGTPKELYLRDAAEITAGRRVNAPAPVRELAQAKVGDERGRIPFAQDFPDVVIQHPDSSPAKLRAHPDYKAAKSGDTAAAFHLVDDSIDAAKVDAIRQMIGDSRPTVVAVHAEESGGRNKLPAAYADALGDRLGLPVDENIIQSNKPLRTGSSALHRITTPVEFTGPIKPGAQYLLADDHISQGGTLADLKAYIERNGGEVVGATTLTGNDAAAKLSVDPATIAKLRQKFPDIEPLWERRFGHGFDGLTQGEASYLARYNSADSLRNQILAGGQEADLGRSAGPEGSQQEDPEGRLTDRTLEQVARGKIRLIEGRTPLITLMRDANASTFMHETGHEWLEQMMQDAQHPAATDGLRTDAASVRSWLGAGEDATITTRQHEKFARGFEQYLREGVAPSPGLARVFAKFRDWLTTIYQTVKGLGKPINEDVRGVFDRMLATEPQRTIFVPERTAQPSIADIHEADAAETDPSEAEPALDRVVAEAQHYETNQPPQVANELANATEKLDRPDAATGAEPAGEGGDGPGASVQVEPDRGEPKPVGGSGNRGEQPQPVVQGGGEAGSEGDGVPAAGSRPAAKSGVGQLAPKPTDLFGGIESELVDKAGNIRLDNLTTREDVAQAIRDAATENDDFIGDRRGVVADGQVMDLADALGMDFQKLSTRKIGQAFNAEQVMAARKLLIQSATVVANAMKKAATGTDQDVMAYAQAKDRHQMIQAQVAGITAEAGRALRAFRNIAGDEAGKGVNEFIKGATGKTLFQLREEAKLGSALETPQQVSKFMADGTERSFGRMLLEYWINGLISGPSTHTTYAIGNTILALEKAGPETAAAALIGRARAVLGREGEVVRMGEVSAQMRGAVSGFAPAVKAAATALQRGVTTNLPGETTNADLLTNLSGMGAPGELDENASIRDAMSSVFGIFQGLKDGIVAGGAILKAGGVQGAPLFGARYSPTGYIPDITLKGVNVLPVGTAARMPGRFIAAIHSFFRGMNYSMAKNGEAYRVAANEGMAGQDLAARVAELRQNPTEEMMERSRESATVLTLMGQGGDFTRKLSALTNSVVKLPVLGETPIFKFIDPFVHISASIMDQSIMQRTPAGLLSPSIRADLLGRNGNVAADTAAAKMLVGTALSVVFGGLAAEGLASGSGPSDPHQAAMWRLAGNQPHSIRIGDIWYQTNRLGPIGLTASIAADMYDVAHAASREDMSGAGAALLQAFTQNILDEGFMAGPAELIQALTSPDMYGPSYVRNFLSSFIPYSVGMAQMARAADPYSRQARTIVDAIKAKVPGLSESLYPRRDIWGEPIPNSNDLGARGLTAIYMQKANNDPVNQAMLQLGIYPAPVTRKIRNVPLTDAQYDDFSRIAGRMTKMNLNKIVNSQEWRYWPVSTRHDVIEATITQDREAARGVMLMKYPEIVAQATKIKLAKTQAPVSPW
jgi:hypothetical protein